DGLKFFTPEEVAETREDPDKMEQIRKEFVSQFTADKTLIGKCAGRGNTEETSKFYDLHRQSVRNALINERGEEIQGALRAFDFNDPDHKPISLTIDPKLYGEKSKKIEADRKSTRLNS